MPPEFDLRLYDYGASANCYKVRLLLAQLERPYEGVPIDIFNGETLTDEYARINPLRSTPVLEVAPGRYLLGRAGSRPTARTLRGGRPQAKRSLES